MYDLVAWGAQALLLNGQIIRSLTLDNPKPKKSRTGDPYKKIPLGLAGHPLTSLVFFCFLVPFHLLLCSIFLPFSSNNDHLYCKEKLKLTAEKAK